VVITTHQPIFLPWPGFFHKATRSDCMVLLDHVQFPRGRGWVNRNRLKNESGELWLTVPVWKKGRGIQKILDVRIYDDRGWRKKHLRSIEQNYARAPYFDDHFPILQSIYKKKHESLVDLNVELIRFLCNALSIKTRIVLQSELGVTGGGTGLLIALCRRLEADRYALFPAAEKHVDIPLMRETGVEPSYLRFHPPVYPQLWGDFIYNLSALDLLLNCGPKSIDIIGHV
jgi:hypothetical protein